MKIKLIAVGKRMPNWIKIATEEYTKRLPKYIKFNLLEISSSFINKNNIEKHKKDEEQKILAAILPNSLVIVLDERGKSLDSLLLSNKLQKWIDKQQHISLIIGGANGLSDSLKKKASEVWSLSKMTLPHGLARVIIVEQIYRAFSIINKHPYHRS